MSRPQFRQPPGSKPHSIAERTPTLGRDGLIWFDPARDRYEEARRANVRRALHTALRYWSACPAKRCCRARQCMGNLDICHSVFWPVVPEEVKVWWRAVYDAYRERHPIEAAPQIANEYRERWKEAGELQRRKE
jgi:hypothetical protein